MPVIFSEEKRKELEKDIKAAALRMFEEKGIRNTTVSEIAQSVGIAKGTSITFSSQRERLSVPLSMTMTKRLMTGYTNASARKRKCPPPIFTKYTAAFSPPRTHFSATLTQMTLSGCKMTRIQKCSSTAKGQKSLRQSFSALWKISIKFIPVGKNDRLIKHRVSFD